MAATPIDKIKKREVWGMEDTMLIALHGWEENYVALSFLWFEHHQAMSKLRRLFCNGVMCDLFPVCVWRVGQKLAHVDQTWLHDFHGKREEH